MRGWCWAALGLPTIGGNTHFLIAELVVYLVRQDEEAVFVGKLYDLLASGVRGDDAGRVRRCIEQQQFGTVGYVRLDALGCELEVGVRVDRFRSLVSRRK